MASVDNFVCLKEWTDKLREIEDESKRNAFSWSIMSYGTGGELELTGDPFADAWLKSICETIDRMKGKYEDKIENGKRVGRD